MTKRITLVLLLIVLMLLQTACGKNENLTPPDTDITGIEFGTETTLDIVTWNLKEFPYKAETIAYLAEIIPRMNVDVIAIQEVMDANSFYQLAGLLQNYNAKLYNATSSYRLGYLYNINTVSVLQDYTIFNGESNPFPRPPYILKINYANTEYHLINNHFKAMGDNFIDETDSWDEEVRRRLASTKLEEYIRTNLPDANVVMMGDLNDQIQEPVQTNVFLPFINRPEEYLFATMGIALNPTINTVSYPSYNSHLDHILISNELFEDFDAAGNVCISIRVESQFGGLSQYYSLISDHRPVGIRLQAR